MRLYQRTSGREATVYEHRLSPLASDKRCTYDTSELLSLFFSFFLDQFRRFSSLRCIIVSFIRYRLYSFIYLSKIVLISPVIRSLFRNLSHKRISRKI